MFNGYTPDSPEEWRPIPGFPDYQISSAGQVCSYRCKRPKLLAGTYNDTGYHYYVLVGETGRTIHLAHRLVTAAFIGPCPDGMEVRHLDGDKLNNRIGNLVYGTHSENMFDQVRHGVHGTASRTHCPQNHPYDEENTYRTARGRYCRTCQRDRRTNRAFRAAGIAA